LLTILLVLQDARKRLDRNCCESGKIRPAHSNLPPLSAPTLIRSCIDVLSPRIRYTLLSLLLQIAFAQPKFNSQYRTLHQPRGTNDAFNIKADQLIVPRMCTEKEARKRRRDWVAEQQKKMKADPKMYKGYSLAEGCLPGISPIVQVRLAFPLYQSQATLAYGSADRDEQGRISRSL
jgi:hypothetical protein